MARRNYKTFTQRELDGWMNLDSSPNEIDNKQCLSAINFNADGNKLVSSKGMSDSGNPTTANIWALTIDSWDIWTVSNWDILKNWVTIDSWTGILVTTNSSTFKPWVLFYITLDWINYEISWDSVTDFIYNLKAAVEANWLITIAQDNIILIRRTDGLAISYSTTENTAYIIYNRDDLVKFPYVYWRKYYWFVIVNWTEYSGVYTMSSAWLNMGQVDIEMITQIYSAISWVNKQLIFLNSALEKTSSYTHYQWILLNNVSSVSGATIIAISIARISWYSKASLPYWVSNTWITVNWTPVTGIYAYRYTSASFNVSWTYSWSITIEWNTITIPTASYWPASITTTITWLLAPLWYTTYIDTSIYIIYLWRTDGREITSISWSITYPSWTVMPAVLISASNLGTTKYLPRGDNIMGDRLIESIENITWFEAEESTQSWTLWIHLKKIDNSDFTVVQWLTPWVAMTITKYTEFSSDIRWVKYEDVEVSIRALSSWTWLKWRSNITVWNIWNLVVDKDVWWAYYAYEWIKVNIEESSIWTPTVGTIYQGKIILWGYTDNDNVVFSQTSSLTHPLNVLEYWAYNAGGQSVSWGNKSRITWFSVGENWLYVFKENEVWYTNSETDSPDNSRFNYIFNKITNTWAYTQNVITNVEQDIFYLDWINRKVRRLSYEQNLTTLRDTAISWEIDSLFSTLPANQELATSSFKYPNYKLYLSDHTWGTISYSNGKTYYLNNKCFVYNVSNKSWFLENDKTWVIVAEDWYIAKNDWKIYLDDTWFKTSGSYLSKHYDMWESVWYKRFTEFDIYWENSNNTPLYLDIYKEWVLSETFLIEGTTFRKKFWLWNQSRFFQFGLRYEWASNIVIHDFSIEFKELYWFDIYKW